MNLFSSLPIWNKCFCYNRFSSILIIEYYHFHNLCKTQSFLNIYILNFFITNLYFCEFLINDFISIMHWYGFIFFHWTVLTSFIVYLQKSLFVCFFNSVDLGVPGWLSQLSALDLNSGHDFRVMKSSPESDSRLSMVSAWNSLTLYLPLPLPHVLTLSQISNF